MLEELKKSVFLANLELVKNNLVVLTWGNVSGIDRESGYIVIKPSGVSYENMKADDMVVVDFDGKVIEGNLSPSSDTKTHIEIYKKYKEIGGVVHTHSTYATAWAQGKRSIPAYGTTHADTFYGEIPCTRLLSKEEIDEDYEKNTGFVIIETLEDKNIKPLEVPGIVVASHGPFTFGESPSKAVVNSIILEEIAKMAIFTEQINSNSKEIEEHLKDKHYLRKHGKNAYYGQRESENNK